MKKNLKMSKQAILVCLIFCVVGCYSQITLSKYFRTCKRSAVESELNKCMLAAVKEGLVKLADGIPDLGMQPLDPYVQKRFKFRSKVPQYQISSRATLRNITTTGLKKASVDAVRAKIDNDQFLLEVNLTVKMLHLVGKYRGVGNFNTLKINSSGDFNVTMHNLKITWRLKGKPRKYGDKSFLRMKKFEVIADIGDMKFYVSNLIPNNDKETRSLNDQANKNWRLLYKPLQLLVQSSWSIIGSNVANKLFRTVQYQEMFPRA